MHYARWFGVFRKNCHVPRPSLGPVLFPVINVALSVPVKLTPNPFLLRPRPVSGSQRPFSVLVKLSRTRISLVPNRYRPSPVKSPVNRCALAPFRYRLSPVHALLVQVKLTPSPSPFVWKFSLKRPVTRTVPSHYANDFLVVLRCIEPVSCPTRYANGYSWLYYDAAIARPRPESSSVNTRALSVPVKLTRTCYSSDPLCEWFLVAVR